MAEPMNTETGVSPEMIKELRKANLDGGFEPVPERLAREAKRVLNGKDIADMDKRFRYLSKKERVRRGNSRHEQSIREAAERLRAQGILR